ncbi:MAG: oxidoreductase [Chloroflexi bacterium]|nr:oxidoreductase [Chloroflexota bacterium]
MWQFETKLSEVIRRTPDVKTFRFDVREYDAVRYQAGQFMFVTIKIKGQEAVHHFTLSSSPTETLKHGYIEFTKRITKSEYSQALDVMKPGDWARLRGPEGDFVLPRRQHNLAFLSGGIGITPLRSMLRFVADRKLPFDIVLIYGTNSLENTAFREELDSIAASNGKKEVNSSKIPAQNCSVRVEYVLAGPEFPPGWQGKKGFITRDVVTELIPDYLERTFYVSGPQGMVLSLEEQLAKANIPPKQIKRDYFPGYD